MLELPPLESLPPVQLAQPYARLLIESRQMIPIHDPTDQRPLFEVSRRALVELTPLAQGLEAEERAYMIWSETGAPVPEQISGEPSLSELTVIKNAVNGARRRLLTGFEAKNGAQLVRQAFMLGVLSIALGADSAHPPCVLDEAQLKALTLISHGVKSDDVAREVHRNAHRFRLSVFEALGARNAPAAVAAAYIRRLPGFDDAPTAVL